MRSDDDARALALGLVKTNPGLALAVLAANRGEKLVTLNCFLDRSPIYVKPNRVEDIFDHPRGARITFTDDPTNRHAVVVSQSAKHVRDIVRNA